MNDGDQRIKCVDCGEEFLFTAGEQSFYASKGLTNAPTRCRQCRELRKQRRSEAPAASAARPRAGGPRAGGTREMHTAVCADCGVETQVPFAPVSSRPVYCRDCYEAHRPARGAAPAASPRPSRASRPSPAAGGDRLQGAVKWFNEAKGFGFIRDDSGEELFVHSSSIRGGGLRRLAEGQRVEFEVVTGPKGRQASDVVPVD